MYTTANDIHDHSIADSLVSAQLVQYFLFCPICLLWLFAAASHTCTESGLTHITYAAAGHIKQTFPQVLAPYVCGMIGGLVPYPENTCLPKFVEKLNTLYGTNVRAKNLFEEIWFRGVHAGVKPTRPVICKLCKSNVSLPFICLSLMKNVFLSWQDTKMYLRYLHLKYRFNF